LKYRFYHLFDELTVLRQLKRNLHDTGAFPDLRLRSSGSALERTITLDTRC
jgi:hypothetical protein